MTSLQMPLFILLGIFAILCIVGGVLTDIKTFAYVGGLFIVGAAAVWITGDW